MKPGVPRGTGLRFLSNITHSTQGQGFPNEPGLLAKIKI